MEPDVAGVSGDRPSKPRRRERFVQSLQRISSTPSMIKVGRARPTDYRAGGFASLSCVSLRSHPPVSASPLAGVDPATTATTATSASRPIRGTNPGSTNSPVDPVDRQDTTEPKNTDAAVAAAPTTCPAPEANQDVLASTGKTETASGAGRKGFNFWADLPHELRLYILQMLSGRQLVRISTVSKAWHEMCFDGRLWTEIVSETVSETCFRQQIPAALLVKIMLAAGPFVKSLNLRGCVQLKDQWQNLRARIPNKAYRNLQSFSIEGCSIDTDSIYFFLLRNSRLRQIHMPAIKSIDDVTMKVIAINCPLLELLNVNWCPNIHAAGLKYVVEACPRLSDLRVSENTGLGDRELMLRLFQRNSLERLICQGASLTNESLTILTNGIDPEIDPLTDRPIVPPRRLRHLDISRNMFLSDEGVKSMAYNVPNLEGLRVCPESRLTDDAVIDLVSNTPRLTHLELDGMGKLSDAVLDKLAAGPAAASLEHLSVSWCSLVGDPGVMSLLTACPNLSSLWLDNTDITDRTLFAAAEQVRRRGLTSDPTQRPKQSLELVVFDCLTSCVGVKGLMSISSRVEWRMSGGQSRQHQQQSHTCTGGRPAAITPHKPAVSASTQPVTPCSFPSSVATVPSREIFYPQHVVHLRARYDWQGTIDEHFKRCMAGRWAAATRLAEKWYDWTMAEWQYGRNGGRRHGSIGSGWHRRRLRRRLRETESRLRADELLGGFDNHQYDLHDAPNATGHGAAALTLSALGGEAENGVVGVGGNSPNGNNSAAPGVDRENDFDSGIENDGVDGIGPGPSGRRRGGRSETSCAVM